MQKTRRGGSSAAVILTVGSEVEDSTAARQAAEPDLHAVP